MTASNRQPFNTSQPENLRGTPPEIATARHVPGIKRLAQEPAHG